MEIKSTRFGELSVPEALMLQFPDGLPGFPEETQFAFLSENAENPFAYLQSAKEENLTFVVVDPFSFFKHYSFELDKEVASQLGVSENQPPQVFSIVRIPEKVEEMTANLSAPIIINWEKGIASQVVLMKSPYSKAQRLFPSGFRKKTHI